MKSSKYSLRTRCKQWNWMSEYAGYSVNCWFHSLGPTYTRNNAFFWKYSVSRPINHCGIWMLMLCQEYTFLYSSVDIIEIFTQYSLVKYMLLWAFKFIGGDDKLYHMDKTAALGV